MLDRIIANKIYEAVEQTRAKIRSEALQEGFELGKQALAEQYSFAEKPISKEATHRLRCPDCKCKLNIPCTNFVFPTQKFNKKEKV